MQVPTCEIVIKCEKDNDDRSQKTFPENKNVDIFKKNINQNGRFVNIHEKVSKDPLQLINEQKNHIFGCPECRLTFGNRKEFYNHIWNFHSILLGHKLYKCENCDMILSTVCKI